MSDADFIYCLFIIIIREEVKILLRKRKSSK